MATYSDRFDPEHYRDDPPFGVGLGDRTPGDQDAEWLPERLASRLIRIAAAYELHLLPLLMNEDRVFLNSTQAEALCDELEFVAAVVNDELIRSHAMRVLRLATRAAREDVGLTLER